MCVRKIFVFNEGFFSRMLFMGLCKIKYILAVFVTRFILFRINENLKKIKIASDLNICLMKFLAKIE